MAQIEPGSPNARQLFSRWLAVAVLILAVPIVPFLLLGQAFEERVLAWFQGGLPDSARFLLIVGVLSADIVLPVPSSMVSTYGGAVLGVLPAAAASCIGMTAGASIGFAAARWFGKAYVAHKSNADDLTRMSALTSRYGPIALVITRALPILAEACVLLMGATGLPWRRFLPPVAVANLAISLVYSAVGKYFEGRDALPAAVIVSGILPLLAVVIVRRYLRVDDSMTDVDDR